MAAAGIGTTLLLDDGKLRLRVARKRDDHLECEIVTGGPLSDRKGVNVPDVVLPIPALTKKDHEDLRFALDHGVDYIGLSFVQRPEDVAEARAIADGRAWIMTKLEKPQALDNLDGILALSDAVMVARGDLGVELPPEEVPLAQKRIVRAARQHGLPVVVATQMLESMISAPAPTRAEASDVATAVFDGADAVMLSAETAAGQYPYEAVNMMDRIIDRVEQDPGWRELCETGRPQPDATVADAIADAARQIAKTIGAKAIAAYTMSGSTALRVARTRPDCPVLGLTTDAADGAAPGRGVGRSRRAGARDAHDDRNGQPRRPHRPQRGLRRAGRQRGGRGRRAVRPAGQHQRAAGRHGAIRRFSRRDRRCTMPP